VETAVIVGFAHHSAAQIVTAAACSALAMAVVSVTLCLTTRTVPAAHQASSKADAVGALPQTRS
jgi:hypothetical protein